MGEYSRWEAGAKQSTKLSLELLGLEVAMAAWDWHCVLTFVLRKSALPMDLGGRAQQTCSVSNARHCYFTVL
eukprot:COSAG06_NODE_672_length_13192_cov_17.308104_2_plen_72_part_00